ncbi:MAG: 3-dehydroquinate synthase family protein, partial [Candidatus Daviesbacteria bacterium]|nr:3-dehydroquinate synthase family protein [Candidatus Daviesbacteria bacterium]
MDIFVGLDLIPKLSHLVNFKKYSKIFIITDTVVGKHYLSAIKKSFPKAKQIIIDPGEKAKNIETVKKIWQKLLFAGCDRKSIVLNVGGGVTGDIGGFAAATYMRGIDFIQIPTTLLAQADASVGGKVAVNFAKVKNLIGSFNQPIAVFCDINFLSTLPDREFISGFAEVIKHGIIADKKYFDFVTSKKPKDFTKQELIKIILGSIKIKAAIVNKDEKETGQRRLLNFGHTIGHAIEAL